MQQIRTLAPTLMDAVNAIEQGCRKVQNDPVFIPDMQEWLYISDRFCWGCLATCTLLQLTNMNAQDVVNQFPEKKLYKKLELDKRASTYNIATNEENSNAELGWFELSINRLRTGSLQPLLKFYKLEDHPCYDRATEWYNHLDAPILDKSTKEAMKKFADFLHKTLIPQLEIWFR